MAMSFSNLLDFGLTICYYQTVAQGCNGACNSTLKF
jgi:hypothetical protein